MGAGGLSLVRGGLRTSVSSEVGQGVSAGQGLVTGGAYSPKRPRGVRVSRPGLSGGAWLQGLRTEAL